MFLGACTFIIACLIIAMANAPFGSSFWSRRPHLAVPSTRHSTALLRFPCKHCAGRGCGGWGGLGGRSGLRVGGLLGSHWFALLARCAALFACLVCCFVLAFGCLCPAGLLFLLQLAPLLVRVCAGRWDRGDKVVSSCWWVRACFIHPETLFQTLSQVISRRIRPRLAPRTPFNNNPAGAVFHRLL